jgi:protein-L-isoaspartate(D-aspartate) O-methyltransferase
LIPLGTRYDQAIYAFTKTDGKLDAGKKLRPTIFVPMTGRAQEEAAAEREKGSEGKK